MSGQKYLKKQGAGRLLLLIRHYIRETSEYQKWPSIFSIDPDQNARAVNDVLCSVVTLLGYSSSEIHKMYTIQTMIVGTTGEGKNGGNRKGRGGGQK